MDAAYGLVADVDQGVLQDARIDGIILIEREFTLWYQIHILFGTADKVDAMAVLPFAPLLNIDAGTVPDPDDLFSSRRTLS
jgi:hypothetical protein